MRIFIIQLVTVFAAVAALQSSVAAQKATTDSARFTTPNAPWTIEIAGKTLYISKAQVQASSGYFLMSDSAAGFTVSVYIEAAEQCKTSESCRDFVLQTGNPAWGKFRDLAKGKIGNFSYFEFYRPEAAGLPLKMLDMYAEFVSDGYWVDLHISKVQYKKEQHALFEDYVESLKFIPKQLGGAVKADDKIEQAAADWLALFDSGKCRETYSSLTSISRDAVTELNWVPYCETMKKRVGKINSRKLIASSQVKSLPTKPGYSAATLHFQIASDAGSGIEFVSMTLEKDGRWTVSNYLLQ